MTKPTLKLKYDRELNEYQVQWIDARGNVNEDRTYYTDDRKDADLTFLRMRDEINAS